jgi:hypothetical protein
MPLDGCPLSFEDARIGHRAPSPQDAAYGTSIALRPGAPRTFPDARMGHRVVIADARRIRHFDRAWAGLPPRVAGRATRISPCEQPGASRTEPAVGASLLPATPGNSFLTDRLALVDRPSNWEEYQRARPS